MWEDTEELQLLYLFENGSSKPSAVIERTSLDIYMCLSVQGANHIQSKADEVRYELTWIITVDPQEKRTPSIQIKCLIELLEKLIQKDPILTDTLEQEILYLEMQEAAWRDVFYKTIKKELVH